MPKLKTGVPIPTISTSRPSPKHSIFRCSSMRFWPTPPPHLALSNPSFEEHAKYYSHLAANTLESESFHATAHIEALLSAVFILLKKEQIAGQEISRVLELLDVAVKVVSHPRATEVILDKSGFGRRLALRIAYLDCRASCFRLGEARFVSYLQTRPELSGIFSREEESGGAGLMWTNLLRMKVAKLDRRLFQAAHSEVVSGDEVRRHENIGPAA